MCKHVYETYTCAALLMHILLLLYFFNIYEKNEFAPPTEKENNLYVLALE